MRMLIANMPGCYLQCSGICSVALYITPLYTDIAEWVLNACALAEYKSLVNSEFIDSD